MQTALTHQVPQRNRRAVFDNGFRARHTAGSVRGLCTICRPGEPQADLELIGYTTLDNDGVSALMQIPDDEVLGRNWLENFTREVVL